MSQTTILADHNIVLEGSEESRAYFAKMLPIALDWAHVHRVASFDSRVAKGDFCKDYKEFCRGNLGISRSKMPQLREDIADRFARSLAKMGIRVKRTRIPVDNLKATQKEINSDKAEGIAGATLSGKFDPTKDPVIVSREGHILDGHHRWAAALVATLQDGVKRAMSVIQIDLPIRELLQRAVNFDGVAFAGFDEGNHKKASSAVKKKVINQMLSGVSDLIKAHVSHSSKLEDQVYKMVLRFKNDLDRRGYSLRDPRALAQDLLYLMKVEPSADWNSALDILDEYLDAGAGDIRLAGFSDGTVGSWSTVMVALMTQYDRAQTKRDAKRGIPDNPYRLALLLGKLEKVEKGLKKYWNRDDEEALDALEKAITRGFTDSPFRRKFLKKLDKFRSDGKPPSYPISRKARFEEGKPADPTKNMSPEDAEEWRENTEKYRDKFKEAEAGEFEAAYFGKSAYDVHEHARLEREKSEEVAKLLRAKTKTKGAFTTLIHLREGLVVRVEKWPEGDKWGATIRIMDTNLNELGFNDTIDSKSHEWRKEPKARDIAKWIESEMKRNKKAGEFEASYFTRSARQPDPELVEDAFTRLEGALRHYKKLPAEDGSYRPSNKDDFMFMGADREFFKFKSRNTRNYLYVRIRDNKIVIPKEDEPFFRGVYASRWDDDDDFSWDDYSPDWDEIPNAGMRALQKAVPGASWKTHAWVTGDLGKWYVFRTVSGAKDQIMVSADGRKTLELPRNPGNYRPYVKQLQRMA